MSQLRRTVAPQLAPATDNRSCPPCRASGSAPGGSLVAAEPRKLSASTDHWHRPGCGQRGSGPRPCRGAHPHTYSNSYKDPNTHHHAHGDTDAQPDTNTNADSHTNLDAHAYTDLDAYAHGNTSTALSGANGDSNTRANGGSSNIDETRRWRFIQWGERQDRTDVDQWTYSET